MEKKNDDIAQTESKQCRGVVVSKAVHETHAQSEPAIEKASQRLVPFPGARVAHRGQTVHCQTTVESVGGHYEAHVQIEA